MMKTLWRALIVGLPIATALSLVFVQLPAHSQSRTRGNNPSERRARSVSSVSGSALTTSDLNTLSLWASRNGESLANLFATRSNTELRAIIASMRADGGQSGVSAHRSTQPIARRTIRRQQEPRNDAPRSVGACEFGSQTLALRSRHLMSQLMIAALKCDSEFSRNYHAWYGQFVSKYQTELAAQGPKLRAAFRTRGGERAMDSYVTMLSNNYSDISNANIENFCETTGWFLGQALQPGKVSLCTLTTSDYLLMDRVIGVSSGRVNSEALQNFATPPSRQFNSRGAFSRSAR